MSTQERQWSSYNEFIKSLVGRNSTIAIGSTANFAFSRPGELEVSLKSDFHLLDHPANQLRARADFDLKVTDSQKEKASRNQNPIYVNLQVKHGVLPVGGRKAAVSV